MLYLKDGQGVDAKAWKMKEPNYIKFSSVDQGIRIYNMDQLYSTIV